MAGIVIPIETARAQKELRGLKTGLSAVGKEATRIEKETQKLQGKLQKGLGAKQASANMDKFTASTKRSSKAMTRFTKQASRGGKAMMMFGKGIRAGARSLMSMQAMIGGMSLAILATTFLTVGAKFEHTMQTVKAVTRATEVQFAAMEAQARKMGATTEWTASQSAEALKFLGMAGFGAAKATEALPGVLDLATASGVELGRAADIASNALTAMQLPVSSLNRVNSAFIATMTRSNVNMEMLAESFKFAAPRAQALGYTVEELSSLIGILGNAGIQGSMAGTQLSFAMGKVSKVFKELGVDGTGGGLIEALEGVNEAGWGVDKLMKVFGERGGRAALVLRQLIPEYKALAIAVRNAKDEHKRIAEAMRGTVIGRFKELKSVMEDLILTVFKQYQSEIGGTIEGMSNWIRANKDVIVEVGKGWWEIVKALMAAVGLVAKLVSSSAQWVSNTAKALAIMSEKKGFWTDLLHLAVNPVGFVARKLTDDEKGLGIIDVFTRGKEVVEEYEATLGNAIAAKEQLSRAGGADVAGLAALEAESKAQEALDIKLEKIKKQARGVGGTSDTKADLERQKGVRAEFAKVNATYRLNDEELELFHLQKEYENYKKHAENKAEVDLWYNTEKDRIQIEQASKLDAYQITELNAMQDSWMIRDQGMKDAAVRAEEMADVAEETFGGISEQLNTINANIAGGLADTFTDFIMGTKSAGEAFGVFSKQVVADLIRMIIKQTIFNSISSLGLGGGGAAAGGMGGIFSAIGSLFGGGRADGGDVSAGKTYWVGERGPEKFTPSQDGHITSAEQSNGEQQPVQVSIANILDPSMMEDWAGSESGQNAIMNVVTANPDALKFAMR